MKDASISNSRSAARAAGVTRPRPRLSIYLERHAAALVSSLGVLWRTPIAALATILALGVTLVFPSLLGVVMINAKAVAEQWNEGGQVTVYVRTDAAVVEIDRLNELLAQQDGIRAVRHITPEAGLAELRVVSELGEGLTGLADNPLPHVLIAQAHARATPEQVAKVRDQMAADPRVERVQSDIDWVAKLYAMARLSERIFWIVASLLGVAVVLTIANAVRVLVASRQEEIEVQKLVGATHAFVRRPLLYSGLWLGFFGGVAAAILLFSAFTALEAPLASMLGWFQDFSWWKPDIIGFISVIGIAAALGWIGAWVSAWHYLRRTSN